MMETENTEEIVQGMVRSAERVLAERFGGSVRLEGGEGLDQRDYVLRLRLVEAPEGAPATLILKGAYRDGEHPYDPESVSRGTSAWHFLLEWAGAEFLSGVPGDPPHTPRFYGGDRDLGFVLLEDLGEGESLADLLQGESPTQAEAGLMALATAMGRMHAATIGRAQEFERLFETLLRKPLSEPLTPTALDSESLPKFRAACEALQISSTPGLEEAFARISASMQNPGPFLAYTHGDPCPDNNRISDGRLRLFDWEHGGFRHALLDGVYGRVPFPTCWCVNRLPDTIAPRMEVCYRAELVRGCPEANDDALFQQALVEACGAWLLLTVGWMLPKALEEDTKWGISTVRQRLIYRLDTFADTTETFGHLVAFGKIAREMAIRLGARWDTELERMPLYPAFR